MRLKVTFFGTCRLLWAGVSLASLIVSFSGYPELGFVAIMLSFPGSAVTAVLAQSAIDATMRIGPTWLETLLLATAVLLGGYVQWFVIGRSLAERILSPFPAGHPLRVTARASVVFVFLGLGAVGFAMVRAQHQAMGYRLRATTVREGMTLEEVRSVLGEPRKRLDPAGKEEWTECRRRGGVRVGSYWFEHEWLPRRFRTDGFVLALCSDQQGRVVEIDHIEVD